MSTVRLTLTCQKIPQEDMKVRVGILLYSRQGDSNHIMQVIERIHYFNAQDRVMNVDDLIPFEELNPSAASCGSYEVSPYLIGPNKDLLKINIVITPLPPYNRVYGEGDNNCSLLR